MKIKEIVAQYLKAGVGHSTLNAFQQKVLGDIMACRTPELGGHIMACKGCGHIKATYNSCNNRHCPSCGGYKRDKWVLSRKSESLPVKYFHLVFTVPEEFNPLCLQNPKAMYDMLFKAAWGTIEKFGRDPKYMGAKTGMIAVLHTWGQNLCLHPHLHCLVPGGGISAGNKWAGAKKSNGKFLFPVKALSMVYKAKFCEMAGKAFLNKEIKPPENVNCGHKWLNRLKQKKWVVYAKKSVAEGAPVVEYIGRYTHKVAISDSRLRSLENGKVGFSWLDYRVSKVKIMELEVGEFVRRFLLHVLPKKFMKVRYYGFMANKNKMACTRAILRDLKCLPAKRVKGLA